MRVLFTCSGGSGHLEPLVPLATAARGAGHTVAIAPRPWMVPRAQEFGFEAHPAGSDEGLAPVTRPLLEVDMEREFRDLRDGFGRRLSRSRAADLQPICEAWRPDVVVWEETDFGAAVVAEKLGLPHASVLVTAAGSFVRPDVMAEALDEVRAEYGLAPDPEAAMLSRHLVLSPFPPSFRDPRYPPAPSTRGIRTWNVRPDPGSAGSPAPPDWTARLTGAPAVYFTLGTVFNHESGDLFERVLAGVRELPINLLVTVGHEIDPATLGRQPDHVAIERFVPQAEVLPHVDLIVSHGGSGSILGALAHGLPMVLLPMGADQPLNADRAAAVGVARVLDVIRSTPADVRDAAAAVLADGRYRAAAGQLRDEVAALPDPSVAVGLLERLVTGR
jgi:UDP:flavonoid glycosyltransferase YjiC (YdhE family)